MTNRALGDLTLSRNPGFNYMVTPESYDHQHMLLNLSPKLFNWSDQSQNIKMFSDTHFKIKSCIDSYRRPQRTPALGKGPKMRWTPFSGQLPRICLGKELAQSCQAGQKLLLLFWTPKKLNRIPSFSTTLLPYFYQTSFQEVTISWGDRKPGNSDTTRSLQGFFVSKARQTSHF